MPIPKQDKLTALDMGHTCRLDPDNAAYFAKCEENLGFVPNVFGAYTFDNAKLGALILMADDLMLGGSGLSKAEREMIAVAVSAVNHCHEPTRKPRPALRAPPPAIAPVPARRLAWGSTLKALPGVCHI